MRYESNLFLTPELFLDDDAHQTTKTTNDNAVAIQITLYDLTYRIPLSGGQERYLLGGLEPLCGTLDPGNMIALMGSSGAGKSTLMDVISKRKTVGIVSGLVLFDGHEPTHAEIGRDTGYVEQQDTLWGTFTVREMMMYTALLKMSSKFSRQQKSGRVDEVIEQMGLTKSRDTKIGGAMVRGVSGGEAKRISVGIGLVNNPRILFLDEPTSGLDSAIALDIIGTVKQLAEEGRTVLCSMYLASGRIFSKFDSIILLSKEQETDSGNIVYFGEAGDSIIRYFEPLGYPFNKKEADNIAAYLMNIIGGGIKGPANYSSEIFDHYKQSYSYISMSEEVSATVAAYMQNEANSAQTGENRKTIAGYANTALKEVFILLEFKGKSQFKDFFFLASRIVLYALASVLLVSLYVLPDGFTPTGLQMTITVIFCTVFTASIISVLYIPSIILERPNFVREINDAAYRSTSYCLATYIIEALAAAISSLLFCSILYWAVPGFNQKAGAFFFFLLTHIILNWTCIALTFTIAAALPTIELACGLNCIYSLMNLAIMGFLSQVPDWWGWASFISPQRWGFAAFMINQYSDLYFPFCNDVKNPSSVTDILGLLGSVESLKDAAASGALDTNNLICGLIEIPSNISGAALDVCPGIPATLIDSITTGQGLQTLFGCTEAIANLVVSSSNETEIYSHIGSILLSLYPQGTNYPAERKFIRYNMWECLGYLCCLLVVFIFCYCVSTSLSLRFMRT